MVRMNLVGRRAEHTTLCARAWSLYTYGASSRIREAAWRLYRRVTARGY
jgi:hypothetical protein